MEEGEPQSSSKGWSIHSRREITSKYQILECIGSGAYSDVYRAVRRSDSVVVALKEVHDYQSAFREIEALQILQNDPNVITLHEYFFSDDEDAVLVLEHLPTDLTSVIEAAKNEWEGGMRIGELKRWVVQVLRGVDACHRNRVVHRDLKPSNLLISEDGLLKIADFGQARILDAPGLTGEAQNLDEHNLSDNRPLEVPVPGNQFVQKQTEMGKKEDELTTDEACNNIVEGDTLSHDGANSCLATCYTSDLEEDPYQHPYSYEAEEARTNGIVPLTSCVGTRWFRAPELLYGSTSYGLAIDLWSLGCIFAELLSLKPIFPGVSDIDQLGKIFSILGNLTEEVWPSCVELPDYKIISFPRVEKPIGLDTCLSNRSVDEIRIVKKLLCFDPSTRASAAELLNDKYFSDEPLPSALSELRIPAKYRCNEAFDDGDNSFKWEDGDSDSDEFASSNIVTTKNGFSIRFS